MLTSALLVVILIMGCGLCSLHCHQRLIHYRQMAQGLRYINFIEKILEHLPQHRGMANAFLNGDKGFLEKMTEIQQILEQDVKKIDHYNAQHTVHNDLRERWQTIKNGWNTLKNRIQSLSASESFELHSALIGEVLYLISDTADRTNLSNHPDLRVRQIIQITFNLLPPIIENIGQARGIGSGAAARGTLLTAIRIKLEFLHQRLIATASNAYTTIERCIQDSSSQIDRDNIARSQHQTEQFLGTMANRVLGEKITISASDFFSEGSSAFNSNLTLLGSITTTLDQQANATIPKLKSHYVWSIAFTTGSFVMLALMCWNVVMM